MLYVIAAITHPVSVERNITLIRHLYEEVDKANLAVLDETFSPAYVDHNPPPFPGHTSDLAGLKRIFGAFTRAFADSRHIVEDAFSFGDKVVVRVTAVGTHAGEFMGIPPTGKSVSMTGIAIYRIASGKIVEKWGEQDRLRMLQQLGVVSLPGPQ